MFPEVMVELMTGRSSMYFSKQPGAEFEWFILGCRT